MAAVTFSVEGPLVEWKWKNGEREQGGANVYKAITIKVKIIIIIIIINLWIFDHIINITKVRNRIKNLLSMVRLIYIRDAFYRRFRYVASASFSTSQLRFTRFRPRIESLQRRFERGRNAIARSTDNALKTAPTPPLVLLTPFLRSLCSCCCWRCLGFPHSQPPHNIRARIPFKCNSTLKRD